MLSCVLPFSLLLLQAACLTSQRGWHCIPAFSTDSKGKQCIDFHNRCEEWALRGECYDNPKYMLNNCRKACGECLNACYLGCVGESAKIESHYPRAVTAELCQDKYSNCTALAAEGECYFFNFEWMRTNCKFSCKICVPTPAQLSSTTETAVSTTEPVCQDKYSNCTALAAEGECYFFNFEWMRTNCKLSCKICVPTLAQLTSTTETTVTTTEPVCQDTYSNCTALAAEGECYFINFEWMRTYCKFSCKICVPTPAQLTSTTETTVTTTEPVFSCGEFGENINSLKYCQVCLTRKHCLWNSGKHICIDSAFVVANDPIISDREKCGNDWVITDMRCEQLFDFDIDWATNCRLCLQKEHCAWNSDVKSCVYTDSVTIGDSGWIIQTENCFTEIKVPVKVPCKDFHKLCLHWANKGGCSDYPQYMHKNCRLSCNICEPEIDCKQVIPGNTSWSTAFQCVTCNQEKDCAFSISEQRCVEIKSIQNQSNPDYIYFSDDCIKDIHEFGCKPEGSKLAELPFYCPTCLLRSHCVWHWQLMNCINRDLLKNDDIWFSENPSQCEIDVVKTACNKKMDKLKSPMENCLSCTDGRPFCSFVQREGNYKCVRKNLFFLHELTDKDNNERADCLEINSAE